MNPSTNHNGNIQQEYEQNGKTFRFFIYPWNFFSNNLPSVFPLETPSQIFDRTTTIIQHLQ